MYKQTFQSNSLYHHGILGMKWGVRRYQNSDGSLTRAGRRRQAREEAKAQKKAIKKTEEAPAKKKLSEMSDDEINSAINRKNLEDRYNSAFPKPKKSGEEFLKKFVSDAVQPAIISSSKKLLEGYMSKKIDDLLKVKKPDDSIESFVDKVRNMSADDINTYKNVGMVAESINKVKKVKGSGNSKD